MTFTMAEQKNWTVLIRNGEHKKQENYFILMVFMFTLPFAYFDKSYFDDRACWPIYANGTRNYKGKHSQIRSNEKNIWVSMFAFHGKEETICAYVGTFSSSIIAVFCSCIWKKNDVSKETNDFRRVSLARDSYRCSAWCSVLLLLLLFPKIIEITVEFAWPNASLKCCVMKMNIYQVGHREKGEEGNVNIVVATMYRQTL